MWNRYRWILLIALIFAYHPDVSGQIPNHRFPRIGAFTWGMPVDWAAKYDLIDWSNNNADAARKVKSRNPNTIIFHTRDWQLGPQVDNDPVPSEYFVRNSRGEKIPLYGDTNYWLDYTALCPAANGQKYQDYVVDWHMSKINDWGAFDGIATDGLWDQPHSLRTEDIDLDRNGVNDYSEHGRPWVNGKIRDGAEYVIAKFRSRIPSGKLILINSGAMHDFGMKNTNGPLREHLQGFVGGQIDYEFGLYQQWMKNGAQPTTILIDGEESWSSKILPTKNDFAAMRSLLGYTLLGDGYFSFTDAEAGEHYYLKWYDEFDTDLGYPKGDAIQLKPNVYARFFDLGVVVFNGNRSPVTVTNGDLAGLSGYSGPYYRFRGGQDPAFNNGTQFSSVTLNGEFRQPSFQPEGLLVSDAILLFTEPKVVVSDIVVDMSDHDTSPGAPIAQLSGSWSEGCDGADGYWTFRCIDWSNGKQHLGYARAEAGSGNARAVYRPNIGASGQYEVFEYHGYFGSSPSAVREATNVRMTIQHANGTTSKTVDQSANYSQWNSLGTYNFNAGNSGNVAFDNNTNGPVMADAIKFVYLGNSGTITLPPPDQTNAAPNSRPGGPYQARLGTAIVFDGSSSNDPDGTIASHNWSFGDGSSANSATASHTYAAAGTYTVTLTVTDNDGAANSAATTATVIADIAVTPTCEQIAMADDFNSASIDASKWIIGSNSGNKAALADNTLRLRSDGPQNSWVITRQKYVAKNSSVMVKVLQPNNDGDLGMSPTFASNSEVGIYSEPNWYKFYVYRSNASGPYRLSVAANKNGASESRDVTGSLVLNGAFIMRMRFDTRLVHFEISTDGINWTETYNEVFALPGYTLDTPFNYEIAAHNTSLKGELLVDDFQICRLGNTGNGQTPDTTPPATPVGVQVIRP